MSDTDAVAQMAERFTNLCRIWDQSRALQDSKNAVLEEETL
jgi:myo-inositol catabolism protein IolC